MKNGESHLQSLRDGRGLYIQGALVEDVTTHPAFKNSVASAASLYDFQSAPGNVEKDFRFAGDRSPRQPLLEASHQL